MSDVQAQQLLDGAARCAREGGTAAAITAARAALSVASSDAMRQRCADILDAYESGTADTARDRMRLRRVCAEVVEAHADGDWCENRAAALRRAAAKMRMEPAAGGEHVE